MNKFNYLFVLDTYKRKLILISSLEFETVNFFFLIIIVQKWLLISRKNFTPISLDFNQVYTLYKTRIKLSFWDWLTLMEKGEAFFFLTRLSYVITEKRLNSMLFEKTHYVPYYETKLI